MMRMGWGVLTLLVMWAPGCMWFCPKASPHMTTQFGEIGIEDYATCRRIRVNAQNVMRDAEGRLAVQVEWMNWDDEAYKTRICVAFFDAQGRRERESYTWDLQVFPPGASSGRWESYTPDAVRYRIDVREAD